MVKNRAAKDAARELKASTGITYPRALERSRLNGKTPAAIPPLRIGWSDGKELTWQPGPGSVLEISGPAGAGKSRLLASLALQAASIETYIIDLSGGAGYRDIHESPIITSLESAADLASALEAAPRPVLVLADESLRALPWQPKPAAMVDTLDRLTSSGAAVITATQIPEAWHSHSSRILLGSNNRAVRVGFLGHGDFASAGNLQGHFRAAGEVSVQMFGLRPETGMRYSETPTPEILGLPEEAMYFADAAPGLYLFAGLTGTGRTSSMAAFLNEMDRDDLRISLIEVTAELTVPDRYGVFRVETGTWDMSSSVKQAIRRESDVIVVGEMQDASTLLTALGAASAGYCVFTTIHAASAESVIERALDMVPETSLAEAKAMMADSLRGILYHLRERDADGARSFQIIRPGDSRAAAV